LENKNYFDIIRWNFKIIAAHKFWNFIKTCEHSGKLAWQTGSPTTTAETA
jgi:hypothetical protein